MGDAAVVTRHVTIGELPTMFPRPLGQPSGQWSGVFRDEFNADTLDTSMWQTKYPAWPRFLSQSPGADHTNTNDASYYAETQVSLADSVCTLTSVNTATVEGLPYTSGMIMSMPDDGGGWQGQYGYFESRIRISSDAQGLWPAWWLSCSNFDQWPPEIDIFEYFAQASAYKFNVYPVAGDTELNDVHMTGWDVTDWHVYGCKWEAEGITGYLDGEQVATSALTLATPQYLILDLAAYADHSPAWTTATMEIDYVRVWQ